MKSRDSSVGIPTDYGLNGPSLIHGRGKRFFSISQLPYLVWSRIKLKILMLADTTV
jgi:hypothetical protein